MDVPEQYMQNMQELLGDAFDDFAASFSMPSFHALRVNTLRSGADENIIKLPFVTDRVPYVQNAFFVAAGEKPSRHPYHAAGLYYLQEPSAMLPADRLPVHEGNLVLDLCAAPGGKATAILAKLNGTGILVANDISVSRTQALVSNLTYTGADNYFVTAESPEHLAKSYGAVFDSIIVDAPCSGEGMFRKDPSLIRDWVSKGPGHYVPIQRQILANAVSLLKNGGYLLYSTCTFSTAEDEEQILWLLEQYPCMHPIPLAPSDGLMQGFKGLSCALRAFPHKISGEGHFLALLQKEDGDDPITTMQSIPLNAHPLPNEFDHLTQMMRQMPDRKRLMIHKDHVYYLPADYERIYRRDIRFQRTGLLLGEIKNGHFKPAQAFALSLNADDFENVCNLPSDDERVIRYLRGETIPFDLPGIPDNEDLLFCTDNYALGFAKKSRNMLKNRLNPHFRWM